MDKSIEISQLANALSKFQAVIDGAKKTADNPFYKSKYADLGTIWQLIREPLTSNGLSVTQMCGGSTSLGEQVTITEKGDKQITATAPLICISVTTMLMHNSGEFVSDTITLPIVKNDPQGVGSAITYARRYALAAILGIHQEDDDANTHATGKHKQATKVEKPFLHDLLKSRQISDDDRMHYASLIDATDDNNELMALAEKINALPIPVSVDGARQKLIDRIKYMIDNKIDGFETDKRRDASIQKHLGCKVAECQDATKMQEYLQYLNEKGGDK